MSFKDVIKSSVLENFTDGVGVSFLDISIILLISCIVGIYIYFVYKSFSKSAFYSKDLNITLAGITIVIAAIMIAMQSNLMVSLGMVGALSIVRFRTAVKNPIDLLYLFWAISAGIICGVQLYLLAVLFSVGITVLLFVLERVPGTKAPELLIVCTDLDVNTDEIFAIVSEHSKYAKENSVLIRNQQRESIYEVMPKAGDEMVDKLAKQKGVRSVNLLCHNGEMRV